ncbi:MAG: hypothetical protein LBQ66_13810 [Planctomycetaceae bacterium]|jgi:hypothetical protein|nr:hypothetical protein [Planctomycetaceae bacterium]
MPTPFETEKFKKRVASEDEFIRLGAADQSGIRKISFLWKGEKYRLTAADFIRNLEPFNQEIYDKLKNAWDEICKEDCIRPVFFEDIFDIVKEAKPIWH